MMGPLERDVWELGIVAVGYVLITLLSILRDRWLKQHPPKRMW